MDSFENVTKNSLNSTFVVLFNSIVVFSYHVLVSSRLVCYSRYELSHRVVMTINIFW